MRDGKIECPYHGWTFGADGRCAAVPHAADGAVPAVRAHALHASESQGYVFVSADGAGKPFRFPEEDRASRARWSFRVRATLDQALENQLDVTHTSVLHAGLFRDPRRRNRVRARIVTAGDRVEVEYLGEPRPSGLVARLLAPRARTVAHVDRLIAPAVTQVEYRMGKALILATTFLTPAEDGWIDCRSEILFDVWLPSFVVAPFLWLGSQAILRQDLRLLRAQTENLAAFGRPAFAPGPFDFYADFIRRRILRDESAAPGEKEVDLLV